MSSEFISPLLRRQFSHRRWIIISFTFLIIMGCIVLTFHNILFSSPLPLTSVPSIGPNWPMIGFDAQQTGFDPFENSINLKNVSRLTPYWTVSIDVNHSSPAVVNGIVYIGSMDFMNAHDHKFYALDAKTGKTLWADTTDGIGYTSPSVVNGIVYVSSIGGSMYALNAVTGKKIWSYYIVGDIIVSPTVANGIVYVSSAAKEIFYALDAKTGKTLWTYPTMEVGSTPAIANGIVYVRSIYGKLYAFDAKTGATLWSTSSQGTNSTPVVANNIVYITSQDDTYAFNAKSGKFLWSAPIQQVTALPDNAFTALNSSVAVAYRTVYVSSSDGHLYALNSMTGKILWIAPNPVVGSCYQASSPTVINGMVFAACNVFNARNGEKLWHYNYSTFSAVICDGVLYTSSETYHLNNAE